MGRRTLPALDQALISDGAFGRKSNACNNYISVILLFIRAERGYWWRETACLAVFAHSGACCSTIRQRTVVTYVVLAAPGARDSTFRNVLVAILLVLFSPLFTPVGEAIYGVLARNRHRLGTNSHCIRQ